MPLPVRTSWHQKFDWKAEEYFDDPQAIALCEAIAANDLQEIDRLVAAGANVNALGKGKMTPLLWALPDNHPERFGKLLELGANPNVIVESDFNTRNSAIRPGDSVTHMVCKTHFPGYFELVFQHGGDPNLVNPQKKETPIFVLITGSLVQRKEKMRLLIDKGADLNALNASGVPATALACVHFGQYDIVLMLLKAGADPDIYLENQNSKLLHVVIREEGRLPQMTPQQRTDYDRLVGWLKEHGASFENARADIERWRSWGANPPSRIKELREAEIAERKARDAEPPSRAKFP
ncbi:ankyrin repeat domain-containing protein [Blastopirellula marina]|nr:ankyrin repeat domain-containing protein [Blastopirellula marina]